MIDLHTHTTESDGSLGINELVDQAVTCGVSVLAKCDHDTTAGNRAFVSYATSRSVHGIAGVELSATWEKGNCHILGLGVNDEYAPLQEALTQIRESRGDRNVIIIKKLNAAGVAITLDEVAALAGGDVVGRPHMARIMVDKGIVTSINEAFDRYLAKGAPAYVERYRLEPGRAVQLLREAGSLVVMAHPVQLRLGHDALEALLASLVQYGLGGIEVYTPYTSDEDVARYLDSAARLSLVVTGGSDFHGESKPTHHLGRWRGDRPIPAECAVSLNRGGVV